MSEAPIRLATVADADVIAALHAASWRSAYRGIFKDSTLGPALDGERRTHWSGKLAAMVPDALLRPGANRVRLYQVERTGSGPRLHPVAVTG